MDLRLNDIVEMKKLHPCGEKLWLVTRVGMDIKLKCAPRRKRASRKS